LFETCFFPQYPPGYTSRGQASKRRKTGDNMAPGVRASKRVRAFEGLEVSPTQTKTRSSKRPHSLARDGQNEEEIPQSSFTAVESSNGVGVTNTTTGEEESGAAAQDTTCGDEDNITAEEGKLKFGCHKKISSLLLIFMKLMQNLFCRSGTASPKEAQATHQGNTSR